MSDFDLDTKRDLMSGNFNWNDPNMWGPVVSFYNVGYYDYIDNLVYEQMFEVNESLDLQEQIMNRCKSRGVRKTQKKKRNGWSKASL
jgi:hypothetical protein